jgi:hypothetical protein
MPEQQGPQAPPAQGGGIAVLIAKAAKSKEQVGSDKAAEEQTARRRKEIGGELRAALQGSDDGKLYDVIRSIVRIERSR